MLRNQKLQKIFDCNKMRSYQYQFARFKDSLCPLLLSILALSKKHSMASCNLPSSILTLPRSICRYANLRVHAFSSKIMLATLISCSTLLPDSRPSCNDFCHICDEIIEITIFISTIFTNKSVLVIESPTPSTRFNIFSPSSTASYELEEV
uniref:Uncharacterized protein n=1 Tax=Guillardia theta TaxID=55529 RepID=A0A7S4JTM8_GUITH